MKLDLHYTGLILGLFMAVMHALWSIMVYFGWAKGILDWVYGLHFMSNPFKMMAFSWGNALWLVLFTFIAGYVMGWIFAFIWNRIRK
ncbi:hypothetical protein MUP46_02490 [Patescibacteria group bacterium]|nr:hypothetical protein [Patescibacteria group bacterium]